MSDLFETMKYLMWRRPLALHDPEVLKKIHHDMFDETWTWAGHYRLVLIHPFPNGNDRHARLVADIYMHQQRLPTLTWGVGYLHTPSELRDQHIQALQHADRGDFKKLVVFAEA